MTIALAAVLGLASFVAAAPAPRPSPPSKQTRALTVKILTSTPKTLIVSPDGEFSAVDGENAITVWSLPMGKPKFLIDRPDVKGASSRDKYLFKAMSFSPDGRHLMAELRRFKANAAGEFDAVHASVVLISVVEEKTVRILHSIEGRCFSGPVLTMCPDVVKSYFSADARHAIIWTNQVLSGDAKVEYRIETVLAVYALDGTKLVGENQILVRFPASGRSQEVEKSSRRMMDFAGVDMDGRMLAIVSDAGSCAVKDFETGKRIAFLDDCTEDDMPAMHRTAAVINSETSPAPFFKVWGFDGNLRAKIPDEDGDAYALRGHALTRDARYALHYRSKTYNAPSGEVALWDLKTGVKISSGSAPEFDSGYTLGMTPDHKHVFFNHDRKLHYASLDVGVPLAPEEKLFIASVDETALSAAPAPAAASAPAPAANFDQPPASKTATDADAYAVVVGIEKYRQASIPVVDFAARDAKTMYDYLTGAMGYDPKNVLLMTNEQATKTDLEKNLGSWLKNRVGAKSRVFVYYAGHGAPNPTTGEGYLMPYEADASYLEDTAYPVAKLYASLGKLPTKSITVVLDACFSGQGARSLIAKGARPLVAVVQAKSASNSVVLSASAANQISSSDPERRHGLFSSRLFQALHGAADADGDGNVTTAEVYEFVLPAVERAARLQNQEQTPTLSPSLAAVKAEPGLPWIVLEKKGAKP